MASSEEDAASHASATAPMNDSTEPKESLSDMGSEEAINKAQEATADNPSSFGRLSASWVVDVHDDEIRELNTLLKNGTKAGLMIWLVLLFLLYYISPRESLEYLDGVEQTANQAAVIVLFVTNMSRFIPLIVRSQAVEWKTTDVMIGAYASQAICVLSVLFMTFLPTPVYLNPYTGQRVHIVRWAEWIALAFLTTFITECMDYPIQCQRAVWSHSICLALSAVCGLLLSVCTNEHLYNLLSVASLAFFSSTLVRLYQRQGRFARTIKGTSVDDQECYDRIRMSLRLLQTSAVLWTLLILGRFASTRHVAPDSILRNSLFSSIFDVAFDVVSKVWYLRWCGEVHELVFDQDARAVRRLEELRRMMEVVWENSSDVICICVKGPECVNAMVSPNFLRLERNMHQSKKDGSNVKDTTALFFELKDDCSYDDKEGQPTFHYRVFSVDMSHTALRGNFGILRKTSNTENIWDGRPLSECDNVTSMAVLLRKVCRSENAQSTFLHDLFEYDLKQMKRPVQFEAKVTWMNPDAAVVVLRDTSELSKRFDREKQLLVEVVERKKDAQANRFTRHEVKNGLLAAIGLVDSARHSLGDQGSNTGDSRHSITATPHARYSSTKRPPSPSGSLDTSESNSQSAIDPSHSMTELDATLHEILDTIMSEAMVRDVIHKCYAAHKESVNVEELLSGLRKQTAENLERFPLLLDPSPFPPIMLDPQLLRYIHRNAVSNAIRYGKDGGRIETSVCYNAKEKDFEMAVINLPGDYHDELLKLDDERVATMFDAGTRLHNSSMTATDSNEIYPSSGDGAWIMQKCARLLGGECSIHFKDKRTVFSLHCSDIDSGAQEISLDCPGRFKLPENATWGIAIDDSLIQRKLMNRFLALAGIPETKRRVYGKNSEEILGFNKTLMKLIRENTNDKFLVIVDENLEIGDSGVHEKTVSGSMCVKQLREELSESEESRLLALIRSANDSADDVARYESRAHGFLPKAPMNKDSVLELIRPWWESRFASDHLTTWCSSDGEYASEGIVMPSREDIISTLEVIHALCTQCNESSLPARWPAIREKIHALKGDLKTMKSNAQLSVVLESLNKLTGDMVPFELVERWTLIRSLILSII